MTLPITSHILHLRKTWSIAESAEEGVEDEVFSLELACELIGLTPQTSGVGVIFDAN